MDELTRKQLGDGMEMLKESLEIQAKSGVLTVQAKIVRQTFESLRKVGFSDSEALEITCTLLSANKVQQ